MKKIILLLFFPLLLSCEDDAYDAGNPKVDAFVAALIEGKYEQNYLDPLPNFKEKDIPALFFYANDFREIAYFPVNPISSFAPPTFRLGECLLWVIEAIRTNTNVNTNHLLYPSLIPVLVKTDNPNEEWSPLKEEELQEVFTLYKSWWDSNQALDFNSLQTIDPLENTDYHWR
jgi:hypothetical protein